jgi:hypothetical protein
VTCPLVGGFNDAAANLAVSGEILTVRAIDIGFVFWSLHAINPVCKTR